MMSSNIGVLQTEYAAEGAQPYLSATVPTCSADKDGIRMESVMASCDCPFDETAVEAVKGSDANHQQRPRA
jgi:hypothetical protein